tara:strand:+ start:400 stop:1212 length:813 start_codon:yes stop_codon:yes gene_type:complete
MKYLLKKHLPPRLVHYLTYLSNWNHNLYSINSNVCLKNNLSDFFIWSKNCSKIEFIAENLRALISGEEVEIIHHFKFFSEDGKLISLQKYKSNAYFEKITLEPIKQESNYSSFTHFVESEISLNDILNKYLKNTKNICEHNRGYTIYYPSKENAGSIAHGNFGGISKNDAKNAITHFKKHIYTPIYMFNDSENYDLVFNNPTKNRIRIKLILNNNGNLKFIEIPSLGTRFFNINNYSGSISFESKLPICRPLVFKNPAPNFTGTFDVFHS